MNEDLGGRAMFMEELIGCFTSPRRTLKSILEKPRLIKATGIILAIALVAAVASFNYMSKLPSDSLPRQLPLGLLEIGSGFSALIGIFGTWIISSTLTHSFAKLQRGNGSFTNFLTLAGYASLPLLIQQLLRLMDSYVINPEGVLQFAGFQLSAGSIVDVAASTFSIFRIWSMILLTIATRENYGISTAKSVICVALSFILIVFLSMFLPLR
ncbi:MAG: YIP1 family protein [Candidatus Bathyarchaeota archaeon]|nr:MAG: YIP1 family protein [Candidatus Bathyarchaeota archaeon]